MKVTKSHFAAKLSPLTRFTNVYETGACNSRILWPAHCDASANWHRPTSELQDSVRKTLGVNFEALPSRPSDVTSMSWSRCVKVFRRYWRFAGRRETLASYYCIAWHIRSVADKKERNDPYVFSCGLMMVGVDHRSTIHTGLVYLPLVRLADFSVWRSIGGETIRKKRRARQQRNEAHCQVHQKGRKPRGQPKTPLTDASRIARFIPSVELVLLARPLLTYLFTTIRILVLSHSRRL